MAQQFRALGAPAGDHSYIPSTLVGILQPIIQAPEDPTPSLVSAHTYIDHTQDIHIYT